MGRGRDGVMMVSEDVMKSLGRRGGKSDATWSCWGGGAEFSSLFHTSGRLPISGQVRGPKGE